jgi:hypothetical protein
MAAPFTPTHTAADGCVAWEELPSRVRDGTQPEEQTYLPSFDPNCARHQTVRVNKYYSYLTETHNDI